MVQFCFLSLVFHYKVYWHTFGMCNCVVLKAKTLLISTKKNRKKPIELEYQLPKAYTDLWCLHIYLWLNESQVDHILYLFVHLKMSSNNHMSATDDNPIISSTVKNKYTHQKRSLLKLNLGESLTSSNLHVHFFIYFDEYIFGSPHLVNFTILLVFFYSKWQQQITESIKSDTLD